MFYRERENPLIIVEMQASERILQSHDFNLVRQEAVYVGQTCQRLAKLAYSSLFYRFYSVPAITKILKTHIPNSQQPSVCFFLLIALICFCCLISLLCSWTAGTVSLTLSSFHILFVAALSARQTNITCMERHSQNLQAAGSF